ncbi:hypothetical protein B0H19DRAFT_1055395 [Mycena capillaripes]|nr:hypothetical protein B0H19DRAFT_1055395 [Mycena capillaripes]
MSYTRVKFKTVAEWNCLHKSCRTAFDVPVDLITAYEHRKGSESLMSKSVVLGHSEPNIGPVQKGRTQCPIQQIITLPSPAPQSLPGCKREDLGVIESNISNPGIIVSLNMFGQKSRSPNLTRGSVRSSQQLRASIQGRFGFGIGIGIGSEPALGNTTTDAALRRALAAVLLLTDENTIRSQRTGAFGRLEEATNDPEKYPNTGIRMPCRAAVKRVASAIGGYPSINRTPGHHDQITRVNQVAKRSCPGNTQRTDAEELKARLQNGEDIDT